jgi:hypothetical protein
MGPRCDVKMKFWLIVKMDRIGPDGLRWINPVVSTFLVENELEAMTEAEKVIEISNNAEKVRPLPKRTQYSFWCLVSDPLQVGPACGKILNI